MKRLITSVTRVLRRKKVIIPAILILVLVEIVLANIHLGPVDSVIEQDIKKAALSAGNALPVSSTGIVKGYVNKAEQTKMQNVLNNALDSTLRNLDQYPVAGSKASYLRPNQGT